MSRQTVTKLIILGLNLGRFGLNTYSEIHIGPESMISGTVSRISIDTNRHESFDI